MRQPVPPSLKIDIVSDVVCPWCAVGLGGLEAALQAIDVPAQLRFHPFELNPDMPAGGQRHLDIITAKYGISADQARLNREQIRQRAASVGFVMNRDDDSRVYNTFDAHRLLSWAAQQGEGRQLALKRGLLEAYFTEGRDIGDHAVLVALADAAGLNGAQARAVLESQDYASAVREEEQWWAAQGIRSVPAVVVNDRYLIEGGQPPEVFEQQLRAILAAAQQD